ncbi:MAG: SH3 domain-containing protein [Caldilinea sp. CFX5]|nr:SH3 domain-containing protein [Caldilinea sp. CFX5]
MLQPKVIYSLIICLFITVVTGAVFFLLHRQLTPLLADIARGAAVAGAMRVNAAAAQPTPTSAEFTLNLLLTVPPTATPIAPPPATPTPPPAATAIAHSGVVNSDLVNLRSYPSLAGDVVGQAREGDRVTILAASNDGGWLQICCPLGTSAGGPQSWIAVEFITVATQPVAGGAALASPAMAVQPTTEPLVRAATQGSNGPTLTGRVNGALVNLRRGPATTYATVGQVNEQSTVTLTGRDATGAWWRICCPPGVPAESWISAEFVDLPVAKAEALQQIPLVPASAP